MLYVSYRAYLQDTHNNTIKTAHTGDASPTPWQKDLTYEQHLVYCATYGEELFLAYCDVDNDPGLKVLLRWTWHIFSG